ncbi:MAG: hypothetical protein LBH61_01380, partial [Dysgonamonadaceae bacterium]|nr:hypothetical protein [Dysgonamonadaceae bacterium]
MRLLKDIIPCIPTSLPHRNIKAAAPPSYGCAFGLPDFSFCLDAKRTKKDQGLASWRTALIPPAKRITTRFAQTGGAAAFIFLGGTA